MHFLKECSREFGKDPAGSRFMRRGRTGDWRNHLTEEQVARFRAWEGRWLAGTDLEFEYE